MFYAYFPSCLETQNKNKKTDRKCFKAKLSLLLTTIDEDYIRVAAAIYASSEE